jgi:ElaB/YqjD/DUF883 family membrane-anchored ribosome-binding protein
MNERNLSPAEESQANLESAIERAKAVCDRLKNQTVAAAKATDDTIREYPYYAVGIALGLGVLIGALLGRSRD